MKRKKKNENENVICRKCSHSLILRFIGVKPILYAFEPPTQNCSIGIKVKVVNKKNE